MRRIGFSRVCSSVTWATSPGVRAIMKMPLNTAGFSPKSARIAPIAPSTLIGSGFFAAANARSTARAAACASRPRRLRAPVRTVARCAGLSCESDARSRHAVARFLDRRERARGGFIHRNGFARRAIGDLFQMASAIFDRAAVMPIDRHDAGRDRRAQRCAGAGDGARGQALGGVAP